MDIRKSYWALCILGALLTISCESVKNKTATAPPPRPAPPVLTAAEPEPAAVDPAPAPAADPVEALIAQVEREYQRGRSQYAAGHLEAAKHSFDRAFNLLLASGLDLRGNDRLSKLLQSVVEDTHRLEMQALKEGDGFTPQDSEPAPIEVANEITFPVDPNVRARAEEEVRQTVSDLPLVLNDVVAGYIQYFSTHGRATMEHAWTRAGRYREMISRILREEGVPQDLLYLAQAESGFHPLALSRAGARGMWQFMGARGQEYGLERNWWVDKRQDPELATRAAARHLKDLYEMFGDWYLAMAAYNSGPGRVQQAVERTGYADFWELHKRNVLPLETRNYVPIIVAVTIMSKNPERYGLEHIQPDPPLSWDSVRINYPVDLRLVAECVDTSVDVIQQLNPSLLRITTPREGEFDLRLPRGSAGAFRSAIAAIPVDKRVLWRYHRVLAGDTLSAIARRYKTTVLAIREVNNLAEEQEIYADSKLVIPVTTPSSEGLVYAKDSIRYRVRRGDTLSTIAQQFGVTVARLQQWNGLRGTQIRAGQTLRVHPLRPQPATVAKANQNNGLGVNAEVLYVVRPGDTLYGIALAHGTTVTALQRDNGLSDSNLLPGDQLIIRPSR